MRLCIFEEDTFDNLYPLTYLRPVFELKCGHTSLGEKLVRRFPGLTTAYFVRKSIAPTFAQRAGGPVNDSTMLTADSVLLVNGRWLCLGTDVKADGPDEVGMCGGDVVYVRASRQTAAQCDGTNLFQFIETAKAKLPKKDVKATLITYPWHLVNHNGEAIEADFKALGKRGIEGTFSKHAAIWGDESSVYVAKGAEVQPFVCLDTTHGPVIIDEGAKINPHTRIEGPCAIGKDTLILGGKMRAETAIGPVCRVGGEVEASIIHGYSNKYHDGFLGHAYVCEWVNLGALTTNSDLKNDYTQVQVHIKGKLMDSHETKVGSFIGDHTKTSIGTYFNSGTVVGLMCNVMGSGGVLPKFLPCFSWFFNNRFSRGYGFKALLDTARAAMGRRKKSLSPEDLALLEYVHHITKDEREELIKKSRRELLR